MAWSGGNFTRANPTWTSDANFGIGIEAGRHDAQDNDFTTGIDQCLNKTGQNSMTGDLNLGGYKAVNAAAGTAAAPAICAGNDVNTGIFAPAADTWAVATNGSERLRVTDIGRVGIGTSSPETIFNVATIGSSVLYSRFSNDTAGSVFELRKSRGASIGTNTIVSSGDITGLIAFSGATGTTYDATAYIISRVDGTPGATNDMPGRLEFHTTPDATAAPVERMRINNSGVAMFGTTNVDPAGANVAGVAIYGGNDIGYTSISRASGLPVKVNRTTNDGNLIELAQDGVTEGAISVSGNTITYGAFSGSHWSQLSDNSRPEILRGTVLETIDELCEWEGEENERLAKVKVSDTVASKAVYGVFMDWDNDGTATNDMKVTSLGAFVCRLHADAIPQMGDLLESNGDGTARVQADDIVKSSTIGKVTCSARTHEYDDGTFCVPVVLMCG